MKTPNWLLNFIDDHMVTLVGWYIARRDKDVAATARSLFEKVLRNESSSRPNLLNSVLSPRAVVPASFEQEFAGFEKAYELSSQRLPLRWEDRYPCLEDRGTGSSFDRHYLYHLAWAAQVLKRASPAIHFDIGSSVYFAAMMAAQIPIRFFDFKAVRIKLDGLEVGEANLLALPFASNSIRSLSCMHVVEHVGLGRYGDPVNPDGDALALSELTRVLEPGGNLLLVLPMGRPRIEFNAHRVYDLPAVEALCSGLEIVEFAYIPESGLPAEGLLRNVSNEEILKQSYGCGCFQLVKLK